MYVTRSGKRVAAFGGRVRGLVDAGWRKAEPKPKKPGRPRHVPGPDHPWRRYVVKAAKGQETSRLITTDLKIPTGGLHR